MRALDTGTPRIGSGSTARARRAARVVCAVALLGAVGWSASRAASQEVSQRVPLGVIDRGVFSDLDERVRLSLPKGLTPDTVRALVDPRRQLLTLYVDDWPTKPYPLTGAHELVVGDFRLLLRPGDRRELAPLLTAANTRALADGEAPAPGDADDDGIPDPLDLLIGAHKTALNGAAYGAGYMRLDYPMGDVPRDRGVCTDVVIRATRNAGLDLQVALHKDIGRAKRAYPMVSGNGNKNIDHRRVKTLLPYFQRHWDERSVALDDTRDPLRPGDIVFMDTFPSRSGPDHIGILTDEIGAGGLPLVINNWTDGHTTKAMDLLGWVPVTHRFRFRSR